MFCRTVAVTLLLAVIPLLGRSQDRPVIVVHNFSVPPSVPWPYDMKQMTLETIAELQRKDGKQLEVTSEAPAAETPANHRHYYALDGEVTEWHPGNRATRLLVGMGSGRETAKIHYWLTDETGKRVFEHTDTIRAAFWENAYAASVGQLAQPFADKIAGRLAGARLE